MDCDRVGLLVCCAGLYPAAPYNQRSKSISTAIEIINAVYPLESRKSRTAHICDSSGPVGISPQRKRRSRIAGQCTVCDWSAPSTELEARNKSGLKGTVAFSSGVMSLALSTTIENCEAEAFGAFALKSD
jgi:hypothetical protein